MLFCTEQFFVFFAAVFIVYWALPWHRVRVLLLLAASFLFGGDLATQVSAPSTTAPSTIPKPTNGVPSRLRDVVVELDQTRGRDAAECGGGRRMDTQAAAGRADPFPASCLTRPAGQGQGEVAVI